METVKPLSKKAQAKEDRKNARAELLAILKPGMKVYTILRHVSRSGMCRHISLFVIHEGEKRSITYAAAQVMGDRVNDRDNGIIIGGCGMDMGFSLVYNLGHALFTRDDMPDKGDPGYALKQEWA